MSRIGNKSVPVPSGVELKLEGRKLSVKGPKGSLEWEIPFGIEVKVENGSAFVSRSKDDKQTRVFHGLTRAYLNNMITGVSTGFTRTLQIEGVGYRAALKGKDLELSLGFSHPVSYPVPQGITIEMEGNTTIHIKGIDKQQVGQVAAEIRKIRPPEPYKGKGVRYASERVRRKAGKTAA